MKIGVIYENFKSKSNEDRYMALCSCGNIQYSDLRYRDLTCEKCGNTRYKAYSIYQSDNILKRQVIDFKTEDDINTIKSTRVFNDIVVDLKKHTIDVVKTTGRYGIFLDFKNNENYCIDSKGKKVELTEGRLRYFFKGNYNEKLFIESINRNENKVLIRSINELGCSLARGLNTYINNDKFKFIQILTNANVDEWLINGCITTNYYNWYSRRATHDVKNGINYNETKPHKIFGLSKSVYNQLKKIGENNIDIYLGLKNIDSNIFLELVKNVEIYSDINEISSVIRKIEDVIRMKEEFNYKISDLIKYITRDVKLSQGILQPSTALELLLDLNKMCKDMQVKINEKYPKSLKRDHDIAIMNYKAQESEINKRRFKKVVEKEEYKNWLYDNKKYIITSPQEPADLVKEGKGLHHCVASYIDDVINEKCKIYFIRKKENINESLLTVEIRGNDIIQIRGLGNRNPNEEELRFINEWTKYKQLKRVM